MKRHLAGAAAVEFAIVAAVFFMLLVGTMEMGRVLFYWNTATELTRMGARMAVVCDPGDPDIADRIASFYPLIPAGMVEVAYSPAGCTVANCSEVTVSVAEGVPIATYIPFVPLSLSLPEFRTTLPRESLASTQAGLDSPVCAAP